MLLKVSSEFNLLGFIPVTYYALFIMTGIIVAAILGIRESRRFAIPSDNIYWGLIIIVPIAIVGARLWYVLFHLEEYDSFLKIVGFNNGHFTGLAGLAIMGGIFATIISGIIYCRAKKMSIYQVFDMIAPGLLVGQAFGRWGNYFNHELYGPEIQTTAYTNIVKFFTGDNMYIGGSYRHPVFFYESTLCLIGLIAILILRRKCKKIKVGDFTCLYLAYYGCVRVFTETLRLYGDPGDPLKLGNVNVSRLFSFIFIGVGIGLFILKRFIGEKKGYIEVQKEIAETRLDTIIFDLDGTLLDTRDLIDRSFIHTFEKFRPGYILSQEELDSFFGPTLKQTFSRYSTDENEMNEMIKYYREFNWSHHDSYVKPFSGAKSVIKKLSKKGYRIAVVSSKKTPLVLHGLDLFGLLPMIDVVIGEDDITNPKPAPDGILKAVKMLGGKNVAYVGDTLNDMTAAHAAGVKAVGCLYISHPEIMLDANPDYVITGLEDLLKICGE